VRRQNGGTKTLALYGTDFLLGMRQSDVGKHKRREEKQLDATECFIVLIICSTCFGHFYAHHQELETILYLLSHMVRNALVASGRLLAAELQAMRPG
jgi:hypothetical protein